MPHPFFDRFHGYTYMIEAEIELLAMGEASIPILETLFNGEACNDEGVPYRNFGLPLRCAMEVANRLGPIAKPLEHHLRAEVPIWGHPAAACLSGLGTLEEETTVVLANALRSSDVLLVSEAAYTLIRNGAGEHPAVAAALAESERAKLFFDKASKYLKSDAT
ncbi:hypothetical protein [Stenotrophomonas sp.]|uniref:hypothetical protein n=1 Tax=Stenotrophomonas sp. TaxID=69392 RepID=UPI00289B9D31|nr:hypothetical protein [Stenotrophomonas sp.]